MAELCVLVNTPSELLVCFWKGRAMKEAAEMLGV